MRVHLIARVYFIHVLSRSQGQDAVLLLNVGREDKRVSTISSVLCRTI